MRSLSGTTITYTTDDMTPTGLIMNGYFTGSGATPPTTANTFGVGCELMNTDDSITYKNGGTSASPSWQNTDQIATSEIANGAVTRAKMSTAAAERTASSSNTVITTTGSSTNWIIVPATGTITDISFYTATALTANDTNYVTFAITNQGQNGAGSTAILAATDANTTKATGGTGITASARRQLTLTGTTANLDVVAGDRLSIVATATGTLAGQLNQVSFVARFSGTT